MATKIVRQLSLTPGQEITVSPGGRPALVSLPGEQHSQTSEYKPDVPTIHAVAETIRKEHNITPAWTQKFQIFLFLIDLQGDFVTGTLPVTGRDGKSGMAAVFNVFRFALKYLWLLTGVICTMDSHREHQVFYPDAHVEASSGSTPDPHTIIQAEAYHTGQFQAHPDLAIEVGADQTWLTRQWTYYCEQLETPKIIEVVRANGIKDKITRLKHALYIWPWHTMFGSDGHRLVGMIEYLRRLHAIVRHALNLEELKGFSTFSEHYSIFGAEVTTTFDGRPLPNSQRNVGLLKKLAAGHKIIVAGLAGSHCLAESMFDLILYLYEIGHPELIRNIYLLVDGTAAVVVPGGPDFTADMNTYFDLFRDHGVNLVKSTDPIETWPGMESLANDLAITV